MNENMIINKYKYPLVFYFLATIIPWGCWFLAAHISNMSPLSITQSEFITLLLILGLCAPAVIAFILIGINPDLRKDFKNRLINFKRIPGIYLFLALFLMLGSILAAQAISLLFGYSVDQFNISYEGTFVGGVLPAPFWLLFAPIVEELAWHTYGTDCLRQRMNLIYTSLIFAVYWALWHFPAFLIKGYFQSNLQEIGLIYSLNFMISIIPYVIIMNWLYYKSNRSIFIAIVFHITANVFNEIFHTAPDSKIIQTVLLSVFAIIVLLKNRDFFFQRRY